MAAIGQVYGTAGGTLLVGTGFVLDFPFFTNPAAVEAGMLLESDLQLPSDARIETAWFELVADVVQSSATVSSVASVRGTTPTSSDLTAAATIDFGGLVTVGGIVASGSNDVVLGISQVLRWTGSGWAFVASGPAFAEIATERLLVQSNSSGDSSTALAQRLTTSGGVVLPAVPSGLELLIDGRTVWFERQGSAPVEVDDPVAPVSAAGVRYVVDRTDEVREAFRRAVSAAPLGSSAPLTVRVGFRTDSPGRLSLRPQLRSLRVHTQDFPPEGLIRTVDLAEEGVVDLDVTPPDAQTVHEVALIARGSFGPERVLPPVGPPINPAARLVLSVGRSVLLGLPRTSVTRFGTLTGVRLQLSASPSGSGGQVTGRLLAVDPVTGRPGVAVDGGQLTPVTVADAEPRWYSLVFAQPVSPVGPDAGDVAVWLELQPGFGEVECGLTSADPADAAVPGAAVRRRLSGGAVGGLTTIPALGSLQAALRVIGLPDRDHPLAAVSLSVANASDPAPAPPVLDVNPTADDLTVVLTLGAPVAAAPAVRLLATCSAPGSLVLDTVRVTYREEEPA